MFDASEQRGYFEMRDYFNRLNGDLSHFANSNDICTPIECVKEMVDSVPNSFWQKRDIKVLDTCCGNGNFHAYIVGKTSLKNLHFNEINPARISNLKNYFGDAINLTTVDFLTYSLKQKYDLVVSNPPYAKFTDGKRCAKNHNMARGFINHSLDITRDGGYVLFIAPNNWMSFSDRNLLPNKMTQYQFRHLNIHGAKKWFPKVGSSFTWFLLQKTANTDAFTVENNYCIKNTKRVKLAKGQRFIPLYCDNTTQAIIRKVVYSFAPKYAVETSSDIHRTTKRHLLSDANTRDFPYKIQHTPTQILWSSRPHKYQSGHKVFMSLTNQYGVFIDDCGMTQSIAFVRCESMREAKRIKSELEHPVFKFINNITRYGNFNNVRVLQNLSRLGGFALTRKELSFVEKFNSEYYGE